MFQKTEFFILFYTCWIEPLSTQTEDGFLFFLNVTLVSVPFRAFGCPEQMAREGNRKTNKWFAAFLHSDHVGKGESVLKLDPWCKGKATDPTSTATSENFSPASKTMSPSLKMGQSESFPRLQLLRYEPSICGRMFRLENKSTSGIHEQIRRTPRCFICSSHLAGKRYKTTGFYLQLEENTVTKCKLAWAQSEEHNNNKNW